tara:strand:- start:1002 stop:1856 length:855 start_codon:yes stop_codon:yes gene_type:complete
MRKYAIVEIKGGFGNQIFQYSFAKYLESVGFKVLYNLSFFKSSNYSNNVTERKFLLKELSCKIDEASNTLQKLSDKLNYLINSKKIKKIFPFINNYIYQYFKEKDYDKDLEYKDFAIINNFDGYWQNNIHHLKTQKESLLNIFDINYQDIDSLNNNKILIHVRRQDYLKLEINLPENYYKNCIDLLKKEFEELEFDIFTDDKDWVLNQNVFSGYGKIYGGDIDPIDSFKKMLCYKHFIIANSTYSYLAAFFGEKQNSKILMPYRWSMKKNKNFLTDNSWEKVKF